MIDPKWKEKPVRELVKECKADGTILQSKTLIGFYVERPRDLAIHDQRVRQSPSDVSRAE